MCFYQFAIFSCFNMYIASVNKNGCKLQLGVPNAGTLVNHSIVSLQRGELFKFEFDFVDSMGN